MMKRRTFVIEAGKAFSAIVGALYMFGCGSSPTNPSGVADIASTSTVVIQSHAQRECAVL